MIYKFYTKLNIGPNIIEEPELNIVGTQGIGWKANESKYPGVELCRTIRVLG